MFAIESSAEQLARDRVYGCYVAEPKIDELLALDAQTRLAIVQEL